jgi:hypothetical protein
MIRAVLAVVAGVMIPALALREMFHDLFYRSASGSLAGFRRPPMKGDTYATFGQYAERHVTALAQ